MSEFQTMVDEIGNGLGPGSSQDHFYNRKKIQNPRVAEGFFIQVNTVQESRRITRRPCLPA
jgi:hypothetical protein